MTLFDYAVLLIFILSIAIGIARGLVREILSLASWVIAFLVANAFGAQLATFFSFSDQSVRLIAAFATLFIVVHLLMWVVSMVVDSAIRAVGLKMVDRGLGSVFGAARGCLIVLILMLVGGMTRLPQQPFWKDAMLRPVAESAALTVKPWLPGAFADYVKF
jgi:membrane protein required for colicin V production